MKRLLCLLLLLLLPITSWAGEWTANGFLYMPSKGAKGAVEKAKFDSGFNKVDAKLGRILTLGDPDYETLATALTEIGSDDVTLIIPSNAGALSITGNTTIPDNIDLRVDNGAYFNISAGITLTIEGDVNAGAYQIFSTTGTVSFGSSPRVKAAYLDWWGAAGDGITDDSDERDAALAAVKGKKIWLVLSSNKTYATDKWDINSTDYNDTWIWGYGSKILHNGSDENLIEIDPGNPGGGAIYRIFWFGGDWVCKQSDSNPTDAVLYLRQVWDSHFRDIRIFCGTDGDTAQWATQEEHADYGIHAYATITDPLTQGGDGLVQFNRFTNVGVYGAKVAGVYGQRGTPPDNLSGTSGGSLILIANGATDMSNFEVGNFVRGNTSKSTARIVGVDDTNDVLYIDRWHGDYYASGQTVWGANETITETTARDDAGGGGSDDDATMTNGDAGDEYGTTNYANNLSGPLVDNHWQDCQFRGNAINLKLEGGGDQYVNCLIQSPDTYNVYAESQFSARFLNCKAEQAGTADVFQNYGYKREGQGYYFGPLGQGPNSETAKMINAWDYQFWNWASSLELYSLREQITCYTDDDNTNHQEEVFRVRDLGDTRNKFQIGVNGTLSWGPGGASSIDVSLTRSAANYMYSNDLWKFNDGVATKVVAGTVDDGDFTATAKSGTMALDSSNNRIYARFGSNWRYAATSAGFEINVEDAWDHLKGPEAKFKKGDIILGIITDFKSDGAPHGEYVTIESAILEVCKRHIIICLLALLILLLTPVALTVLLMRRMK